MLLIALILRYKWCAHEKKKNEKSLSPDSVGCPNLFRYLLHVIGTLDMVLIFYH